jgi:hypothetical protein
MTFPMKFGTRYQLSQYQQKAPSSERRGFVEDNGIEPMTFPMKFGTRYQLSQYQQKSPV